MLEIRHSDCSYGIVGTPTNMKSIYGEQLDVGDVVRLFDGDLTVVCVCEKSNNGIPFVMGIMSCCEANGTIEGDWGVEIHKKYTEVKAGESYYGLQFVEEIEE